MARQPITTSNLASQGMMSKTKQVLVSVSWALKEVYVWGVGFMHATENLFLILEEIEEITGGIYGATTTFGNDSAVGAPVQPPDLSKCQLANDVYLVDGVPCCPPYGSELPIFDFKLPDPSEPMRVRRSVLNLDVEYLAKFREAIRLMKVHGNWHFLPWHRFYIYFWERILGKLIGEPTFAIPFWNRDSPEGMRMPSIYKDEPLVPPNPLHNCNRNPDHLSALMNYKYQHGDPNITPEEEPRVGKFERSLQHPYWDMGNFHTAARDPIFFGHTHTPHNTGTTLLVSDCLDHSKLRYTYETEQQQWLNIRQSYFKQKAIDKTAAAKGKMNIVAEFGNKPRVLDTTIRALVPRPKAFC
ncbi:Polyphenol oxidase [Thalictrum thalictroides]|uniref:Polyphenol oxidase n=1 Tax=Thalictrum thalictroides TaxID=46969 RepID=A0A7J6X759_THATH|nr:Polyphenol oxidase [Thalictrum thalictroides]